MRLVRFAWAAAAAAVGLGLAGWLLADGADASDHPSIAFSSVLAGTGSGAGRALAVDGAGNTYVTGETSPAAVAVGGHPAQSGSGGAGTRAFVTKLDRRGAVVYTTHLGGTGYTAGRGIAVDASGAAYLTGATNSTDFPTTPGALQRSYGGGPFDAFVTKLDPSGRLAYSTYLGDTHYDEGNAIAVDGKGQAVITGRTVSPQFPVAGPLAPRAVSGAIVTKLNRTGSRLVSSTVFGGGPADHGNTGFGIAVDRTGSTYVTGVTNAADFPTVRPLQPRLGGGGDAFVIKIEPRSTRVVYSTFFGGAGDDVGRAVAADGDGYAYVTGLTTSSDLPTPGALQPGKAGPGSGGGDAFVVKIDPAGKGLVYSTYLGGAGEDGGSGIAVDRSRDVFVVGSTASGGFPVAAPVGPALRGGRDAFVTEIDPTGGSLAFSTDLGGSADDAGLAVALDRAGAVRVAGLTSSSDFPLRVPAGGSRARGVGGAFVASIAVPRTTAALVRGAARPATGAAPASGVAGLLYEMLGRLYNREMATMNISSARENLPEAVELARTEAVFLERYGRPAAVLVSPERYEILLSALEDAEDVAAFDAAMAEEGDNIPWDQVKADLGWT